MVKDVSMLFPYCSFPLLQVRRGRGKENREWRRRGRRRKRVTS